jgi:hypothetical protein
MRVRTEVIRTSSARKEERLTETLMEHFFIRVWDDLVGRTVGPMHFRLILQPVMAGILGIRAGLRDARKNKSSYSNHRCNLLRERGKDIASVFVFALILDVIYQLIALHTVYPGEAVLVAIVLAIAPYLLVRSLINCLTRKQRSNYE